MAQKPTDKPVLMGHDYWKDESAPRQTGKGPNAFGKVGDFITRRSAERTRQHTMLGLVMQTSPLLIRLDNGPTVPSPFVLRAVTLHANDRVLCGLLSGGHDVVVLLNRGQATEG